MERSEAFGGRGHAVFVLCFRPTQDDCDERVLVTLGAIRASLEMHARILAATVEHHCLQVVEIVEGEEALAGGGASAEAGLVGLVAAAAVLFL